LLYRSVCTVPIFLSGFNETLNFLAVSKNNQIQNFVEILPVGAEMVHGATDGETERQTDGGTERRNEAKSRF
jgi:hypothetical protein